MDEITKASKDAATIFLRRVIDYSYHGSINGVQKLLEKGPTGRAIQPKKLELYEWYEKLDERERQMVLSIVEETAKNSVFSFLVVLDNKAIGPPIEDRSSDFAIYLQTYENDNDRFIYSPKTITRINRSYSIDGDLHDEFAYLLHRNERGEKEEI
jgi:hypothetical protein